MPTNVAGYGIGGVGGGFVGMAPPPLQPTPPTGVREALARLSGVTECLEKTLAEMDGYLSPVRRRVPAAGETAGISGNNISPSTDCEVVSAIEGLIARIARLDRGARNVIDTLAL